MQNLIPVPWLTGAVLSLMPMVLLAAATPRARSTRNAALSARNRVRWAAMAALLAALLADLSFFLGDRGDVTWFHFPLPVVHFSLPISIAVNGVTMLLATLVSFVILMIAQYSVQYLDGDPQQARFSRLLAVTGGCFLLVVISGNIGLFTVAIFATGFSLHKLLKFYRERPKAIMAAHKKALFSRTADLFLFIATILLGQTVGSLQFSAIEAYVAASHALPAALQWAAWLVIAAVILKSAHFPFQGWLIQVMEAPTPVSALMHAGVVYSGAIVALRLSPLLVRVPETLWFLGFFGLVTVLVASLAMTTQAAVKSMLAWSTAAQLGFMSLELGLGLFPLALLHLVGHSLYKAHAFLSSGSVTDQLRQVPAGGKKIPGMPSWISAVGLAGVIAATAIWAFGENPAQDRVWWALGVVIAVAVGQILVKGFQFADWRDRLNAVAVAVTMAVVYLGLHTLFVWAFSPDLAAPLGTNSSVYLALIDATVASFLLLSWVQGPGRKWLPQSVQLALYVHFYNGLYVDYWVDRFSHKFWAEKVGVEVPRKNLALESLEALAKNREESVSTPGGVQ